MNATFPCYSCKKDIRNPYFCFERRVECISAGIHNEKRVLQQNIQECEILLLYCCNSCWESYQDNIADILCLHQTFPSSGLYTPCSRCGDPVNRMQPHISYVISKMEFNGSDQISGKCLDEDHFAILCKFCEPNENRKTDASSVPLRERLAEIA